MRDLLLATAFVAGISGLLPGLALAQSADSFREVLSLADLDPNSWPELDDATLADPQTQSLVKELLFRINQFSPEQLKTWAEEPGDATAARGSLIEVQVTIESVAVTPADPANEASSQKFFLCKYRAEDGSQGRVLTPKTPSTWIPDSTNGEPVRLLGLVLATNFGKENTPLLLSNHLSWYPERGVSSGRLLLSKMGADVALLDEVRHRQPFVKPNVSREGEAFYACLNALDRVDPNQLDRLARENVARTAKAWKAVEPRLRSELTELRQQLADSQDATRRQDLQEQINSTRRQLAIAAAVQKRAELGVSSAAPMFLLPEQQTGELVRVEGTARRAVRMAATQSNHGECFEIDVFPSDSQNLPIVCCVNRLPEGFPLGDQIRAHVRIDGVFFKSWRYRTRKNSTVDGQTTRQQQMYTPVVVGGPVVWFSDSLEPSSQWGIWGGVGFLLGMVVLWIVMVRSSRRQSLVRSQLQQPEFDKPDLSD